MISSRKPSSPINLPVLFTAVPIDPGILVFVYESITAVSFDVSPSIVSPSINGVVLNWSSLTIPLDVLWLLNLAVAPDVPPVIASKTSNTPVIVVHKKLVVPRNFSEAASV